MRIAYDAKRLFSNPTGLGNYSRMLVQSLATYHPAHTYLLAAPKLTDRFDVKAFANVQTLTPAGFYKKLPALWRSYGVTRDLKKMDIELYHGLSNEIPAGLKRTGIKSVVTIHDLIFERYPKQYSAIDTAIYRRKFRYAAAHADKVIAISEQTKQDLIHYYNTPEDKIAICYQSCNPVFERQCSVTELTAVKNRYNLPEQYFLFVGSVIERKKLLTICEAMTIIKTSNAIPLVVIGTGNGYMEKVKAYIGANGLTDRVIFLSEQAAKNQPGFRDATDFPAIYQSAIAMIYPSIFEGFGLPVLEALWSRLPVITSNLSCLPETGGDAAYYIDPLSASEMADAMEKVWTDMPLRNDMIRKGLLHAQNFTMRAHADNVMQVYQSLL